MPDFILEDNQGVPVAVEVFDTVGNIVQGAALDAGSVTAVVSDDTILTAVVSPDQSSVQVDTVGPEATGVTVTVSGTLNGTPLTAGVLAIDVVASAAASIGLVPGTPGPRA